MRRKNRESLAYLKGAVRPLYLMVGICVQYLSILIQFAMYSNAVKEGREEFSVGIMLNECIGDRYQILIMEGFYIVFLAHVICERGDQIGSLWCRLRSERNVRNIKVRSIAFCIAILWMFELLEVSLLIGLNRIPMESIYISVPNIISLWINKLFFWITVACISVVLNRVIQRRLLSSAIVIFLLISNVVISNSINFMDSFIGRNSWIGKLLIARDYEYSVHWIYWIGWVLFLFIILEIEINYSLYIRLKKIAHSVMKMKYIFPAIISVFFFLCMGSVIRKNYGEGDSLLLIQCFSGFRKFDIFLILYMFYQIPILIFLFWDSTQRFMSSYVQYGIRTGGNKKWVIENIRKVIFYTLEYYVIGTAVLWIRLGIRDSLHSVIQEYPYIITMWTNICLQTILISTLALLLWLLSDRVKNFSLHLVLMVHLILVLEDKKSGVSWIPLVQGIYTVNFKNQMGSLIYQSALILMTVIAMMIVMRTSNERIMLIHWRD